jgi:DNA-binding transcriptional LysR family regulator
MNVHHLELFFYVAKHRGISSAARHMPYGIQQPAISGQIGQLERSLGISLFHRRPFALTAAGTRLLAEIEPFFGRLADLPAHLRGQKDTRLRLAAPAQILRDYLPDILAKYKRRWPEFRLTLHDVNQAEAEELLRRREIDLAFTELEGHPAASVQSCTLISLPLVLVVAKQSSVRSLKDAFRNGRHNERLISLPPQEVITQHFETGLKRMGLSWSAAIEVSSIELVDTYAALGFGVGASVAIPKRKLRTGLRQIALPRFSPVTISALWADDLSPLATEFLDDVKKIARELSR